MEDSPMEIIHPYTLKQFWKDNTKLLRLTCFLLLFPLLFVLPFRDGRNIFSKLFLLMTHKKELQEIPPEDQYYPLDMSKGFPDQLLSAQWMNYLDGCKDNFQNGEVRSGVISDGG